MKSVNDISKWQDTADFRQMSTLSSGVILRAGPDRGSWEDIRFKRFRDDAESIGFPYGNYWYYLNAVHPKRQAEFWARIVGSRHGELGCWLDLEDSTAGTFGKYTDWWDCVQYFKQLQPTAKIGIYTRAEYFNDYKRGVPNLHAFRDMPLWIAQYKTNKPNLPKGWNDWLIWQWTDSGDGIAHGVGSKEIDCNWYKGGVGETPTPKGTLTVKYGNNVAEYRKVE